MDNFTVYYIYTPLLTRPTIHTMMQVTGLPFILWRQLGNHHYNEIGSNCYCGNLKVVDFWQLRPDSCFLCSNLNIAFFEMEVPFINISAKFWIKPFPRVAVRVWPSLGDFFDGWVGTSFVSLSQLCRCYLLLYQLSITSESANLRSSNGNPLIKEANWDEGRRGSGGKIP